MKMSKSEFVVDNAKIKELKELCEKTKKQNLRALKATKPFYVENYLYYEGKVDLSIEILKLLEENDGSMV